MSLDSLTEYCRKQAKNIESPLTKRILSLTCMEVPRNIQEVYYFVDEVIKYEAKGLHDLKNIYIENFVGKELNEKEKAREDAFSKCMAYLSNHLPP